MIETIDNSLFRSRFEDYNRVGENKNFSYKGLDVLFDYLEDLEDSDNPIELDVIGLCCDFSECSISDLWNDYSNLFEDLSRDDFESDDELNDAMLEVLRDHTIVLEVDPETYITGVF
jgi:hypothetical protein